MNTDIEFVQKFNLAYNAMCKPLCQQLKLPQTAFDILMFFGNNPEYRTASDVVEIRRIKARVVHPMLTAVILWAIGHLLFVGSAHAVTLFAAFAVWALADRLSLARRKPGPTELPPFGRNDVVAVVLGLAAYGLFVWKAHLWLIGVSPLG